jgi:hypothetical protein
MLRRGNQRAQAHVHERITYVPWANTGIAGMTNETVAAPTLTSVPLLPIDESYQAGTVVMSIVPIDVHVVLSVASTLELENHSLIEQAPAAIWQWFSLTKIVNDALAPDAIVGNVPVTAGPLAQGPHPVGTGPHSWFGPKRQHKRASS